MSSLIKLVITRMVKNMNTQLNASVLCIHTHCCKLEKLMDPYLKSLCHKSLVYQHGHANQSIES